MIESVFAQMMAGPRLGIGELFGGTLLIGSMVLLGLWSLIDAARSTEKEWSAIGRGKGTWVIMIICANFFCGPIGLIFSIYYLVMIRPELHRARTPSF